MSRRGGQPHMGRRGGGPENPRPHRAAAAAPVAAVAAAGRRNGGGSSSGGARPQPVATPVDTHERPPGTLGSTLRWIGGALWRVVYVGPVFFAEGPHVGLEQLEPCEQSPPWRGDTGGTIDGVTYFACDSTRGCFAPFADIAAEVRAARDRAAAAASQAAVVATRATRTTVVAGAASLLAARGHHQPSPLLAQQQQQRWAGAGDDSDVGDDGGRCGSLSGWGGGVEWGSAADFREPPRDGTCVGLGTDDSWRGRGTSQPRCDGVAPSPPRCDAGVQAVSGSSGEAQRRETADAATSTELTPLLLLQQPLDSGAPTASAVTVEEQLRRAEEALEVAAAVAARLTATAEEVAQRWAPFQRFAAEAVSSAVGQLTQLTPTLDRDAVCETPFDSDADAALLERHARHVESAAQAILPADAVAEEQRRPRAAAATCRHGDALQDLHRLLAAPCGEGQPTSHGDTNPCEGAATVEAALEAMRAGLLRRCAGVVEHAVAPLAAHLADSPDLLPTLDADAAIQKCSAEEGESDALEALASAVRTVANSCETARRAMFDAEELAARMEIAGRDGDVRECEALNAARVTVLESAQAALTDEALPCIAPALTRVVDTPRRVFSRVFNETVGVLARATDAAATTMCGDARERIACCDGQAAAAEDALVRGAFASNTAVEEARRELQEACVAQRDALGAALDALRLHNECAGRATAAMTRLKECASERLRVLPALAGAVRTAVIEQRAAATAVHVCDAFATLLRTLRHAWCPAVEEAEMAALAAAQRALHERRRHAHDMHVAVHRALCHAAGELEWKRGRVLRGISDRLRDAEVAYEVAADSLDPRAKELAAARANLEALRDAAAAEVATTSAMTERSAAAFAAHTAPFLVEVGAELPRILDEVHIANEQRDARIREIEQQRMLLLCDKPASSPHAHVD